ncbi:unnamed protein product [Protopolystoma xenopodis]|uniref:Uncharacterized protein n=1 Tax=Protopolystoma xenopodis TaxID=117903 RepID=A0A448WHB3_9PLAT|nr:unnamed protein product [Protopolystoma xenopodis]
MIDLKCPRDLCRLRYIDPSLSTQNPGQITSVNYPVKTASNEPLTGYQAANINLARSNASLMSYSHMPLVKMTTPSPCIRMHSLQLQQPEIKASVATAQAPHSSQSPQSNTSRFHPQQVSPMDIFSTSSSSIPEGITSQTPPEKTEVFYHSTIVPSSSTSTSSMALVSSDISGKILDYTEQQMQLQPQPPQHQNFESQHQSDQHISNHHKSRRIDNTTTRTQAQQQTSSNLITSISIFDKPEEEKMLNDVCLDSLEVTNEGQVQVNTEGSMIIDANSAAALTEITQKIPGQENMLSLDIIKTICFFEELSLYSVFGNIGAVFRANCFFWLECLSLPLLRSRETGEKMNPSLLKKGFVKNF